jgi:uncharacterized protein (DUF934 family)
MLLDKAGLPAATIDLETVLEIADTIDPRTLPAEVDRAAAIALTFPVFRNGRAFSQAAVLRKLMGYRGILIARGAVLVDQVRLMREAGFDLFEVADGGAADAIAAMLARPDPARWRDTAVAS